VGDYTSVFTAGRTFVIAGSAGNNGTYTVVSSTTASFQTNITVSESIPSATVDGSISYVSTGTSYGYRLTRDRDGSGSNQWYAGDALLNTGTTGNGYIDLFSNTGVLSGNGPTIIGNVRTSATYNAIAARWAIGNLKSIYGYSASDVYGAAFGDPSATNITIDATNGLRIRNGTTDKLTADTSGNLSLVGDFAMSTSGVFRAGATAINTGTGWWLDYNAGTPRFRVGNPSGAKLQWDGSALTAAGWTLNASTITGGNATLDSTGVLTLGTSNDVSILSAADSTYRLWVGHATAGSAPFRVTKAGAATLTSVTINAGNVTLDSDGVTIGGAPSGFSSASMYKFTRPTGLGFGQSGDVYGTWFSANAGLDDIVMENKIVGTTFSSGTARVILKANGWSSSGGGASTGEAAVEVNSGVAQQRVTLSGDQVRFTATTSVQVTSAVFQVTNAAANLQVTDTTTTMSIQPGFFGTTSNHAWIALTNNGTNATFCAAGGITIGSPTGGCKGSGTLNATAVYDDNVLLTDWVFDLAYDPPRRTAEEWPPSTRRLYSLAEVRAITQVERRLPWMPSSTNFERERHTGGMVTRLYQGQEQQQLYLFDLETRIAALEQALGRR
jgi:hypothetical protein